ncbi:hypothetical protein SERLA73DRAFT_115554 [Serpula lacrymans var. lacrymans S7.3]|uniref:NGG1p interacting factor 3 n=2 Tax=Serpula lacrymans var. lacrymans TaxID=341189 RepID=F8QD73_SERL3|nr:uncharacterized protein SERLADRAFT_453878 [Serpula lacrymans var. lacrymans S7.9]EGN93544.1 hypothetical protein SERLA73DRAFT_115554 [Serpula lacrymans var. lacrymans S7.3]EGO18921.1 hypothetical protein SERLADRAFT_453878 [Serpula lacrymans var. lacrymans S7.9]
MLTIDLTPAVLAEALATPTAFVIAYHPPIFKPISSLTLSSPLQTSILLLAAQGISVFTPHTALDSAWEGINDWLAKIAIGVTEGRSPGAGGSVSILGEMKGPDEGGLGRLVLLDEPVEIDVLISRIKRHLNLHQVEVGFPATAKPIRRVAICAGAGGSVLAGVDADVYFTGEMAHHEVLAAVASGRYVVLCGHTNTERGYLPELAPRLSRTISELIQSGSDIDTGLSEDEKDQIRNMNLEVVVSKADEHPLKYM